MKLELGNIFNATLKAGTKVRIYRNFDQKVLKAVDNLNQEVI